MRKRCLPYLLSAMMMAGAVGYTGGSVVYADEATTTEAVTEEGETASQNDAEMEVLSEDDATVRNKSVEDNWYEDYEYTLEDGKIILNKYIGKPWHIYVQKSAVIDGVEYQTSLEQGYIFSIWSESNVSTIDFEDGFIFPCDSSNLFYGCSNLTDIDLSGVDASNVTDMNCMFGSCKKLKNINFKGFDTSSVKDMNSMFWGCNNLQSIDVSNFDTKNVTNMAGMFCDCRKLQNIDVSNFDTSNVTDMNCMFMWCNNLQSIDLSNFDTSSVTDMCEMFEHCQTLQKLDISSFDTSSVTYFDYMFSSCYNLKELNMSGCDFSSCESDTDSIFIDCNRLETVYTPINVQVYISFPPSYRVDGKLYYTLPCNTTESIKLIKDQDTFVYANTTIKQPKYHITNTQKRFFFVHIDFF